MVIQHLDSLAHQDRVAVQPRLRGRPRERHRLVGRVVTDPSGDRDEAHSRPRSLPAGRRCRIDLRQYRSTSIGPAAPVGTDALAVL